MLVGVCSLLSCNRDAPLEPISAALEAAPFDFGAVIVGSHMTAKVPLHNHSPVTITVFGVDAQQPFVGTTLSKPLQIPAGQTANVEVSFSPLEGGNHESWANVRSDATENVSLLLKGFGAQVQITANPSPIDFGTLELNSTHSQVLTLSNQGNVDATVAYQNIEGQDAALFSIGAPTVIVPAGGQAQLSLNFLAGHLSTSTANLRLSPCPGCTTLAVPMMANVVSSALQVQPSSVDFGILEVGGSSATPVTVSNVGTDTIHVSQVFITAESDPDFSVDSNAAFDLQGGQSHVLTVTLSPTSGGSKSGTLRVMSDDPNSPKVDVPLSGSGSAVQSVVQPLFIDFGPVPVGLTATRMVTLFNTSAQGVLNLTGVPLQGSPWFADNMALPQTIQPGDHLTFPINFMPLATGDANGLLLVQTDEAGGTEVQVHLKGQGVQLGACSWAAVPTQLNFHNAHVGEVRHLAVAFENTGTNDCYFGNVQLANGSDPSFSLTDGPVPSALLHAGDVLTVRVSFIPTQEGSFSGALQFIVSDPQQPSGTVSLYGSVGDGCLVVSPADLNFGTVPANCPAYSMSVSAMNTCASDLQINSVAIGTGDSNEFSLTSGNSATHTLAAGTSEAFTVAYQPTNSGPDSSSLLFNLGGGIVISTSLEGTGVLAPFQTDHFTQADKPKVDLLFIVDNSGSMANKQDQLAINFENFIQVALTQGIDYHIAVTTTGIDPVANGWTSCPGGAEGGEAGRFFPADNSSPRILTSQTPNPDQVFSEMVHVGTCTWLEQGLEAAYFALSPPLVNSMDDPNTSMPNDGNAGFLRDDARLAIIVVSDADDQSDQQEPYYESFFRALKSNQPGWFILSAIVTPLDKQDECPTGESSGVRYIQMAQDTGGVIENICTPDWATSLEHLAQGAFGPTTQFPLSAQPIDPTQISVSVNGQSLASGWTYNATTNAIVFDSSDAPPPGSSIDVSYPLGC
jgi:hypothetical protein